MDSSIHFRYAEFLTRQMKLETLEYVEKALEQGYSDLIWIGINPDIGLANDEPHFHEPIREIIM